MLTIKNIDKIVGEYIPKTNVIIYTVQERYIDQTLDSVYALRLRNQLTLRLATIYIYRIPVDKYAHYSNNMYKITMVLDKNDTLSGETEHLYGYRFTTPAMLLERISFEFNSMFKNELS